MWPEFPKIGVPLGTPRHHPFSSDFPVHKNHPAIKGYLHDYGNISFFFCSWKLADPNTYRCKKNPKKYIYT